MPATKMFAGMARSYRFHLLFVGSASQHPHLRRNAVLCCHFP